MLVEERSQLLTGQSGALETMRRHVAQLHFVASSTRDRGRGVETSRKQEIRQESGPVTKKEHGAGDRGGESKGHLLSWDNNLKPGRFSSVHGGGSLQRQRGGKKKKKKEGQRHFSCVKVGRSSFDGYGEEKKNTFIICLRRHQENPDSLFSWMNRRKCAMMEW